MGGYELFSSIRFRNPGSFIPLIVQCSMLLSSCLVLLGLLYVIFLVLAMTFHHIIFDRNPKRVPDFVKRSNQFDSDSDDSDLEVLDDDEIRSGSKNPITGRKNPDMKKPSHETDSLNLQSKRAHILDKFLKKDIDVNKK